MVQHGSIGLFRCAIRIDLVDFKPGAAPPTIALSGDIRAKRFRALRVAAGSQIIDGNSLVCHR